MGKILINVRPVETRVAYIENEMLVDLKIERRASPTLVGSIHRGVVARVLPGMQAAFVDIGLDRAGFLYVGDVREDVDALPDVVGAEEEEESTSSNSGEQLHLDDQEQERPEIKVSIEQLIKEGQNLLVQVAKDPIGTKGARLTTHISLPARQIVFMPTVNHLGISRRIEEAAERDRLLAILKAAKPKGGVIVRTAGEGTSEDSLARDLEYLERLWKDIYQSYEKRTNPGLVHAELDVSLRALRDMLSEDVSEVLVDDHDVYISIVKFISQFMPHYKDKIRYYKGTKPLFDVYDIDLEISRSLERRIWLKSGGYIVFDEAEALVVIDVNTGRYVGKRDFEETILKTNLEAVREIAHQLRIRNCGGIIIIDFIDMKKENHREKVLNQLKEELKKDRAKTNVVSMSELGLVEMTRKRISPSLTKTLCEPCLYCDGQGYIKRKSTVAHEIFRALERESLHMGGDKNFIVSCNSAVADWIYAEEQEMLEDIEMRTKRSVVFKVEPNFHLHQFKLDTI